MNPNVPTFVPTVPTFSLTEPSLAVKAAPEANTTSTSPSLKDKGILFISDIINSNVAQNVVSWILEANMDTERKYDHLTLIINSPGGEMPSAFAIIDTIAGSRIPVHTVGLGQISSCGFLIFISGAKGYRILTPNTTILSHQWFWGNVGKAHELLGVTKQYNFINERMEAHYVRHTGLDIETIRTRLLPPTDTWLSADEAKEMGICDEIRLVSA